MIDGLRYSSQKNARKKCKKKIRIYEICEFPLTRILRYAVLFPTMNVNLNSLKIRLGLVS